MSPGETGADRGDRAAPPRSLGSELATLFRRRRTIAMLASLALVPILIAIAVRVTSAGDSGRGPAFIGDITQNGLFVAFTALTVSIPLFLPLTIGVVAGDTIAGEASLGTLRYLLIAPAGRIRLLAGEVRGGRRLRDRRHPRRRAGGDRDRRGCCSRSARSPCSPATRSAGEFILRALLLVGYVTLSLLGLSAIGLFISTLTTVPVGAMAATIVLAVASQIMDALPQLSAIHPWLFSHYWFGFADLLRNPISWDNYGAERPAAVRLPPGVRHARLRSVLDQGHPELSFVGPRTARA